MNGETNNGRNQPKDYAKELTAEQVKTDLKKAMNRQLITNIAVTVFLPLWFILINSGKMFGDGDSRGIWYAIVFFGLTALLVLSWAKYLWRRVAVKKEKFYIETAACSEKSGPRPYGKGNYYLYFGSRLRHSVSHYIFNTTEADDKFYLVKLIGQWHSQSGDSIQLIYRCCEWIPSDSIKNKMY